MMGSYTEVALVNWDPKLGTAISDDELENKDVDGHLWSYQYPIEGRKMNL